MLKFKNNNVVLEKIINNKIPNFNLILILSKYYIKIFIVLIFLIYLWIVIFSRNEIIASAFLLAPLLILLILLAEGYYNVVKFIIYRKKLIEAKDSFTIGNCIVINYYKPLRTTPIMKNDNIYIEPKPVISKCLYLLTSDYFILFNNMNYFYGIIKINTAPLVIKLNETTTDYLNLKKEKTVESTEIEYNRDFIRIEFKSYIRDLKEIRINDFDRIIHNFRTSVLKINKRQSF
jgi:hypothetical protein